MNDVEYKKQIIAEAQQLGVANRLQFTGTITDADKIWYYKHALCLALPSLAEGFGLPVVEAMHWGTPLLLSQMGSIPEIAGDAGVYITH
ncbi:glycosyltransferase, partial [Escherichia coli]